MGNIDVAGLAGGQPLLTYWLLFALIAWMAISHMRPHLAIHSYRDEPWNVAWVNLFLILALLIGLRHEVGGDWETYLEHIEYIQGEPLDQFWLHGDPAYVLLNWVGANVFGGVYFVNFVCALLFSWGLITFCRAQPRPWLVLAVAVPYLITVVAMGYTRQGVAIGLAMLAMVALNERKFRGFLIWITFAALFHKSAVILMPLAIFSGAKHRWLVILGAGITGALLFTLLLQEALDGLVSGYIVDEYQSSGAGIRIAMNVLPAVVFLCFRKRFKLPEHQESFWTWMAVGALIFVVLLAVSPSSTAVDRVALYWIPLQLFVWGRLPDALGLPGRRNPIWVILVVAYSALVLLVWLFFAGHSFLWLPYKHYFLQLL
ncbi:EpsG family protein [Limnobacter sp. P1]|uniref:EpsG family protein n=1 Tax=Limnobacter olei TaxID=3031298 RepID=UPI0023AF1015|nr:EpsG family protein [Limnobacter sp. P1]